MSQYPKHDKVLELARKELGVTEHPDGSNTGPRVLEYQRATWLGGTGWPWCAAFTCWCWQHAGFKLPYKGAGAYAWYDEGAKTVGQRIARGDWREVTPGDGVVFAIGAGHIGLVEGISDGMVRSIDGNTSDMVAKRSRPLSSVYGFVHLNEKLVKPPKPVKPPTFEVVSGENGAQVFYSGGDSERVAARLKAILKAHPEGVVIRPRKKK